MGLARQGGPWGCSYQPETRLQEGRKGNSGQNRDKEGGGRTQHNGSHKAGRPKSDFVSTWPPVCSHSPCKYLLMFISLLRWVRSEALSYDPQILCLRPWAHPARAISIVLSYASHRNRPFRTKLPPCPSPGTLPS